MIYFILYLLISYTVVFIAMWLLYQRCLWRTDSRFYARQVYCVLVGAALLILPAAPYAYVEWNTYRLRSELTPIVQAALREIGFEDQVRSIKALSAYRKKVRIYVVTPCLGSSTQYRACTIQLARNDGKWIFIQGSDKIVWSDCGSADGNIFPPYPR